MKEIPTPDSLRPGDLVGPWRVEGYAGRGTYGVVYRARRAGHPGSVPVALKMALFPDDPRSRREVELLSRFHHPAVPRLIDRGWWHASEGVVHPYLVMEWIRGLSLYRWARVHSATQRQVLRVVAQVAWGLEEMHRSECLHRDVKGDNILVEPEGRALLTDFGSGTWAGASPITDRIIAPGTPEYRSPDALRFLYEHWRDKGARYVASPADDLYALGVSLYKLVTGLYPPPGTDPERSESPRRGWHPPRLQPEAREVRVLPEVEALVERMMARAPEARGSARKLAEAAESVVEHAGAEADVPLFGPEPQAPVMVSVPVRWGPHDIVREPPASEASGVPVLELGGEDWPAPEFLDAPVLEEVRVSEPEPSGYSHMLPSGFAAAAVVLVALGLLWGSRGSHEGAPELERADALADGSAPDAGTRGLGDSTPTTRVVSEVPPVVLEAKVIAEELLDEPIPNQRRAPCRGYEQVEINGGCWHLLTTRQPPCGDDAYEWKGACYYPILERAKPRSSKKPR